MTLKLRLVAFLHVAYVQNCLPISMWDFLGASSMAYNMIRRNHQRMRENTLIFAYHPLAFIPEFAMRWAWTVVGFGEYADIVTQGRPALQGGTGGQTSFNEPGKGLTLSETKYVHGFLGFPDTTVCP
nr:hypothetical protein B1D4.130 [imported] - Neurospora crassa [Neurospora crassa]